MSLGKFKSFMVGEGFDFSLVSVPNLHTVGSEVIVLRSQTLTRKALSASQ